MTLTKCFRLLVAKHHLLIASRIPPGRLSENCKQMCLISDFSTCAADFLFSLIFLDCCLLCWLLCGRCTKNSPSHRRNSRQFLAVVSWLAVNCAAASLREEGYLHGRITVRSMHKNHRWHGRNSRQFLAVVSWLAVNCAPCAAASLREEGYPHGRSSHQFSPDMILTVAVVLRFSPTSTCILEEKTVEIGTQSGVFCCLDTHLRGTTSRVNFGGQFDQNSQVVLGPIFAPFSKNVQCVFQTLFWKVQKLRSWHFQVSKSFDFRSQMHPKVGYAGSSDLLLFITLWHDFDLRRSIKIGSDSASKTICKFATATCRFGWISRVFPGPCFTTFSPN